MSKEFLGIGWKFPVTTDGSRHVEMSDYEQDIREAIWIILSTAKGERLMRPDFGCGIHDFVFASINSSSLTLVERTVREALNQWEPRIVLADVKTLNDKINEGKLMISIDYRVRTTNNRFNMVFPFYLTDAK
ncbi:MAG TPA: GPW/gp25 family protein [Thermodesulfovibrionales bacterium]|nr:GPW/gp25 family protein [Thermodesulfovibrionales bacterium]